ncbi:hypothetical protein BVRB_025830, partial [Beta vulgaris subsp. vulgaris]
MNENSILQSGGKGKCTKIFHVFGDGLWQYGDQSVPSGGISAGPIADSESTAVDVSVTEAEDGNANEDVGKQADAINDLNLEPANLESGSDEQIEDLKTAIESAATEFLQSASVPIACGEVADAVSARDPRFNIRSTPYRTWEMLFRMFAKRGVIKIKDGIIVSTNMLTLQPKPNDEVETVDMNYMDELL